MTARAVPRGKGKPAVRRGPPARTRKAGIGARIGKAWAMLPIPRAFLRALRTWSLIALLVAGIVAGVIAMGVPQAIGMATAHAAGRAGFVVRNVQVEGRDHVDRDAIYRAVMDARGQDMPLVDLAAMRRSLLNLAWVKDARVSRRLPDTLVVNIVERRPVAIWQYQQRLALVDAEGDPIAPLDPRIMPDQLPIVIGREANHHVAELQLLIASQPTLRPLIQDATWLGDRRWDLRFNSGESLMLPEGDMAARQALAFFARKDSESRLLGKGFDHFDMRDPAHVVVRVTREPGLRLDKVEPAPAAPALDPQAPGDAAPVTQTIAQEKIL